MTFCALLWQGVPEPFVPPMALDGFLRQRLVGWYRPYQDANVQYDMMERELVVSWAGLLDPVDGYQDSDHVTFSLDYFPTNVDILGDSTLLIGGVDDSGATLLERFDFRWPKESRRPVPTPSGGLRYQIELPEHYKTTRAYSEKTPGRHLVRFLLGVQDVDESKAPRALVQFHDSSDLYTVDSESGQTVLLASAQSPKGKLGCVPFLGDGHSFTWKADRVDHGFIYVFAFRDNVDVSDPPTLVFVDPDRDGEIDNFITVPPGQWRGTSWADGAMYIW